MSDMKVTLVLDAEQLKKGVVEVKSKLAEVTGQKNTQIKGDATQLKSAITDAQKSLAGMAASIFAISKVWSTFTSTINQAIDNARAQVIADRMLEAQLLATGNAAGISAGRLKELASELQKVSNMGDEAITQNLTVPLTTFKSISGPIFERTMKAVLDLNAVIGDPNNPGSMRSVTMQLGKALNDPITGLTALRRSGVSFTESQKETIRTLVESNRILEAQTVILDEMEAQFGGAAAAAVNSAIQMKNAWADMLESMGMATLPVLDGINLAFANFFSLLAEQHGAAFANQQDAMLASFKTSNDFATGLSLNFSAFADFIIGSVAYVHSAINGLTKTARTSMTELVKYVWNVVDSLPTALADAVTGMNDWKQVKDIVLGVGDGFDAVSAQVQNTNNEMHMNMNFMLSGFRDYEKNFADITQKSVAAYQQQLGQRKALQQQLEELGSGTSGGSSVQVAAAETEYQKLLKLLQKYHFDASLENLSAYEKESAILQKKFDEEAAIIANALANKEITQIESDAKMAELDGIYNGRRLVFLNKSIEDAKKLNGQGLAEQEADLAKYYEAVKFADASYMQWKTAMLRREVALMQVSDEEKKNLLKKLLADLELERIAAAAKPQSTKSWFFGDILGYDPDDPEDIEKIEAIKSNYHNLSQSLSNIANGMMSLNRQRRDEELAAIDEQAAREKWSAEKTMNMRQQITKQYEAEERKLKRIQKAMSLASAVINTAEGTTKALSLGPIIGPIMAAIISAMGAVQIGIISAQKFADGGLFRGQGGPRDDKNIIAVSDGEYIVNAAATRRNKALLDAINYGSNMPITQKFNYQTGGVVSSSDGLHSALNRLEKRLEMINLNIAALELQTTIINHAPDVKTTVERHEIVRLKEQKLGREYGFGL